MASEFFSPNSAAPAGTYLKRVWGLRYFIIESARARMESKNYDTKLGNVWLALEPILFVLVYYLLFSVIGADRGLNNFLLFLVIGRFSFGHHRSALGGAANSLRANIGLLENTNLPRAVVPCSAVAAAFFDFGLSLVVMLTIAMVTGVGPSWSWLAVGVLTLGQLMSNAGFGLLVSQAAARWRDVQNAIPVVMRLLFYASGVIVPIESYVDESSNPDLYYGLLMLNPFYGYVKGFQFAVMGYDSGHPRLAVLSSVIWTLVVLPFGFWWFLRNERRFGLVRLAVG